VICLVGVALFALRYHLQPMNIAKRISGIAE